MAGWSQMIILGNVGRDPEMRYTQSGVAVCSFTVAVTRRFGSGDQRQEKTQWVRVSCWNKLAETANQWIKKGMQVMVVGNPEVSAYLDKSGQPQASLELRADNFQMLGQRGDGQGSNQGGDYGDYGGGSGGSNVDEIPF
ncbi:MAG: single-stranded DNA-binding protein [Chloroflexi bacterium]|nr:single-stranded DNA-binding protein [Chloroflexota bacterium]